MDKKDLVSSSAWLFIGLCIIVGTVSTLEVGTANEPGPGLLPLIAGILVACLSLVIFLKAVVVKTSEKWSLSKSWEGSNWLKLFYTIAALLIYAALLETVGFLFMTLLLLVFIFRWVEPQKWGLTIGLSILASGGAYLVFDRLLQAQLPKGFLGF